MFKKILIIFLIPILFYSCGYSTLYSTSNNQNINIKILESSGDRDINNFLLSYTGPEKLIPEVERTDVIFLNGTKSEEIIKQKKLSFIKKAKAVIFKTDGYVKFFKRLGLKND